MLSQRYKPTEYNNIIGNNKNIECIVQWINDFNISKNTKKCLLISGNSGIGKTLSVELILKNWKYKDYIITYYNNDQRYQS